MPPRRRPTAISLTAEDLSRLADEVSQGRRPTVYLVEAVPSLGLEAGSSARVVSVDGDTVMVSPRGVNDELPYEASELRLTKSPAPAPATTKRRAAPAVRGRTGEPTAERPRRARSADTPLTTTPPAVKDTAAVKERSVKDSPVKDPASPTVASAGTEKPKQRAASKKSGKTVTVTIYGSADNEWFVALTRGAHKPQRARQVTPDVVDAAMRELGDEAAREAVESVMVAAREEAKRRVEDLSRELEQAREALAALGVDD